MVSKQSLAVALSRLKAFAQADIRLEQYPTESEVAAELLWEAHMRGHLGGRHIADLGAGTGILSVGASILGARVIAIERDPAAISVLRENADLYEGVQIEVREGGVEGFGEQVDTVLMNPPFGTKQRHADRVFLERAFRLAPIIYSIHKASTKGFVHEFAQESGYVITWEADRKLPLKRSMPQHTKDRKSIDVTLFRLERR